MFYNQMKFIWDYSSLRRHRVEKNDVSEQWMSVSIISGPLIPWARMELRFEHPGPNSGNILSNFYALVIHIMVHIIRQTICFPMVLRKCWNPYKPHDIGKWRRQWIDKSICWPTWSFLLCDISYELLISLFSATWNLKWSAYSRWSFRPNSA